MSEKHQNKTDLFPDGSEHYKLTEEDKYESRTETDSGFLSGGNLLVSGEITSQEEEEKKQQPTVIDSSRNDKEQSEVAYMHIDSGVDVCLSETFSSLSLKHPDLNDLNSKGTTSSTTIKDQKPAVIIKTTPSEEQQPWQIYFEQDEDGDT